MLKSQDVTMDITISTILEHNKLLVQDPKTGQFVIQKSQDITNYKKRDDEELKTMDYLPPG